MEVYTGKLRHYNDRKMCGKLPLKKTAELRVTSTYLSIDCKFKTCCLSNKPLHIESAVRYKHNIRVIEYSHKAKGKHHTCGDKLLVQK
jgi:hypothetical protein